MTTKSGSFHDPTNWRVGWVVFAYDGTKCNGTIGQNPGTDGTIRNTPAN